MGRGHYEVMDYEVMERGGERGALRSNGHYAVMGGGDYKVMERGITQ
jgi:hypothetical protein